MIYWSPFEKESREAEVLLSLSLSLSPANMYIWDPYGQNLGIYPIGVLHWPRTVFLPI